MNKVVTINLNGNAYQLEEPGYEALRAYLDDAKSKLVNNPDRDEIMRDLEQATADKLGRFLNAQKSVVTESEVAQIIAEMGPVDSSMNPEQTAPTQGESGRVKKLYRIPQGAMLAGVANGVAAYFDIDVVLVRVLFVLLTLLSGGAWIVVYIAMAIIIPRADTPEQISRASGAPFSAQEVVDRAHRLADDIRANTQHWKHERREWRRQWRAEKRRIKWEARHEHDWHHHYHHHSVIGELFQIAFIVLIFWAVYTYIPETQPFYHTVGGDIQSGWAWLNAKVAQ